WFIVNGVLICYGPREHTLISCLNCHNYPLGYKEIGNRKFVNHHFKEDKLIRLEDVKAKLVEMGSHRNMLKIMVLFFLESVVCVQTKVRKGAKYVLKFSQGVVDDLHICKTFPWGRYSYDYMLKEISHTIDHFGGLVKEKTFIVDQWVLAFETIHMLGMRFIESVERADINCMRMCQSMLKRNIDSILPTKTEEEQAFFFADITEEDDDVDVPDLAVDSWVKRLREGYSVLFKYMYEENVVVRALNAELAVQTEQAKQGVPEKKEVEQKKMLGVLIKK
ncbi:hypothetical protein N665_0048s0045, partial [Sinapis alba]